MNLKKVLSSLVILLYISCFTINAQTIERGPYLQLSTTTSIFVHWRTSTATEGKVWYGTNVNNLNMVTLPGDNTTDHEIQITGLTANTTYYYAVGYTSGGNDIVLAGEDINHYFKTNSTGNEPMNIWVLGDAGKKNAAQRSVRDGYYNYNGSEHIDMMLLLGDNAYNDGDDEDYQEGWFENMYEDRLINSVMWPTFGNHDAYSSTSSTEFGPYYDIFNLPRAGEAGGVTSGTEAYYSFDYGNVHVISLNSEDIDASPGSDMIQWLQADVNANNKEWLIAMFHHPPFRGAVYEEQANMLPILEAGGVDLVLYGHYHRYERSFLINGHYGLPGSYDPQTMTIDGGNGRLDGTGAYVKNNNGEGTVYVNTGSAGTFSANNSSHPIMVHNAPILGSVDLNVNDTQMDVKFIDANGAIIDYFTIVKPGGGGGGTPPSVSITNPSDNDFFPVPQNIAIAANATDNDGTIAKVEFFVNNVLIKTDNSAPYTENWTPPANGSYQIKATATDNDGLTAIDVVTVHVGDVITSSQVSGDDDDAEEIVSSGEVDITSSDLEMTLDGSDVQKIGMRFNNLNIPQGATITDAYIQLTADETDAVATNLQIYAEKSISPAVFDNDDFDISSRAKTVASASWLSIPAWDINGEAGEDQKTPDLSGIIQEVVNQPGFSTNSSIVILVEGTGKRVAKSGQAQSGAPILSVTYNFLPPLPVELIDFTAKAESKEIRLDWSTATEINNDFFNIERSRDALVFQSIGTIPGNGNTTENKDYNFLDRNPEAGLNYYRLKQTDFDGKFTYSKIVSASIDDEKHFKVYPSLVAAMITIEKDTEDGDVAAVIFDLAGKKIKAFQFPANERKTELSLNDLPSGTYFLSLNDNKTIESFKFFKL